MDNTQTTKRFAIVLAPKIDVGAAVNAVAIVTGGLQSQGFDAPIVDQTNVPHAAVRWNLVVLQARSQTHIEKLIRSVGEGADFVVFTASGRALSNSFDDYKQQICQSDINYADVIAIGLFGDDSVIRGLTKQFSVFKA